MMMEEMVMEEIIVRSTLDHTDQPSLFYFAGEGKPLLVGLHTWSFGRKNQVRSMLPYAKKLDFNLLLPEFRGANKPSNPNCKQACGSALAIGDIFDAIDYVSETYKIDRTRIMMLGMSGGGHMALLAAAKNPELFRAVGAVVPLTDMISFHAYTQSYRSHIEACLGGTPEEREEVYKERSPISYVDELARVNLKIFHGKFDRVVPFSHSMNLYNLLCERHPESRVFLEIFDGAHEIDLESAFYWLVSQLGERKATLVTG